MNVAVTFHGDPRVHQPLCVQVHLLNPVLEVFLLGLRLFRVYISFDGNTSTSLLGLVYGIHSTLTVVPVLCYYHDRLVYPPTGAISAFDGKVQINGNTTATHNSANSRGGETFQEYAVE